MSKTLSATVDLDRLVPDHERSALITIETMNRLITKAGQAVPLRAQGFKHF